MFESMEPAAPAAHAATVDLSILIVTWHSERWIDRCLQSIPAACDGLEYEVVLHDNSENNIGFAAAINQAFLQSRGRYALLLNPDCELGPGAITQLYEFLESHPQVAAAAPLLVDDNGDAQRDFQLRRLPTLAPFAAEVLLIDKLFPMNPVTSRYRCRDLDLSAPCRIEQPAAAALLLRRSVAEEIGPMDEEFAPAWFEDVDYCRRIANRGKEIWLVPSARVRHFGGASLEHMPIPQFIDVWYRNMWRYAKKWLPASHAEGLRWIIIGGMVLRSFATVFGIRHHGLTRREAVRGYVNVLRKALGRWTAPSLSSS